MKTREQAVAAELVALNLEEGLTADLAADGDSMGVPPGSGWRLVVHPLRRRPRFGDVVLFRRHDGLVVHRVVGLRAERGGEYLIKGDRCLAADPPVARGDVLGLVVGLRHPGGRRTPWTWRFPWSCLAAAVSRGSLACRTRRALAPVGRLLCGCAGFLYP